MKMRLLKIAKILLIPLGILLVLFAVLLLALKFGGQPEQITKLGSDTIQQIKECTGATVPSSAKFVEGWHIPGRDPSEWYIFELDFPQQAQHETEDAFVRRTLDLQIGYYDTLASEINEISQLTGINYPWVIEKMETNHALCHYAHIHYCKTGKDTILVAFHFGFM